MNMAYSKQDFKEEKLSKAAKLISGADAIIVTAGK